MGAPSPKKKAGPGYSSPLLKGRATLDVEVDVSSFNALYLQTGDGGDGNGHDHTGWFDPIIITRDGKTIDVTTLKWTSAKSGWGEVLVCFGGSHEHIL